MSKYRNSAIDSYVEQWYTSRFVQICVTAVFFEAYMPSNVFGFFIKFISIADIKIVK